MLNFSEKTLFSEINLIQIGKVLYQKRFIIIKIVFAFILLGFILTLILPKQYKAEARLLPEIKSSSSGASALLKQFGGLGGLSFPIAEGEDAIAPMLYPDVIKSTPFYLELLKADIKFSSSNGIINTNVYQYIDKYFKSSVTKSIKKYTIWLPWTIVSFFKGKEHSLDSIQAIGNYPLPRISKNQWEVIRMLRERVIANIDQKKGIITISAEFPDPYVSYQIAYFTVEYLRDYITYYRIEKSKVDYDFIKKRFDEKEKEYLSAQLRLAQFKDANRNVILSSTQVEEQKYQNMANLAFNVYNGLAQQLEQARIKVQEVTPVIKVLEPVQVPVENSKPNKILIMFIFVFFGVLSSFSYVLWKELVRKFKTN